MLQSKLGTYTCHFSLFFKMLTKSPRPVTYKHVDQAGFQLLRLQSVGFIDLTGQRLAQMTLMTMLVAMACLTIVRGK